MRSHNPPKPWYLFCCSLQNPTRPLALSHTPLKCTFSMVDIAPPVDHYGALFASLAQQHFSVTPHEWQIRVGSAVIRNHAYLHEVRFLCVQGTGKGKSILYQTLCAHFKGVSLYISPLLTLSADQVNKLMARVPAVLVAVSSLCFLIMSHQSCNLITLSS